ncbi:hypothetical protein MIND_00058300 [Mycena indigotica]|uniref:C-8 sterol isomerase n=1 Tax=Mycena indigotica TaxID=2126181 RepID=A0A8H6WE76_9AGAR|nr:uncharacterized protein MIND_00058300 [Mycena indigotica]KAF7315434.1 hypothetical protein MIND_00058300 [Mycena indigotica]
MSTQWYDSQKNNLRLSTMTIRSLSAISLVVLVVVGRWLDNIKRRWYVLDPESLHELAKSAVAAASSPNDTAGMIQHIVTNLTNTYSPSQIKLNRDSKEWVFNNAGGAMGAMYIIHASITEYLIIFGTPLGTEGHSGVHTSDDYFNILVGEEWAFAPGSLEMERYTAGMVNYMSRGTAKQYKMHRGCFALEYARGWIPPMLPFGFIDTFTSTLDFFSLYDTCLDLWYDPEIYILNLSMTFNLSKWNIGAIALLCLVVLARWLDHVKDRWYVFDPDFLHELAQSAVASAFSPNDTAGMIDHIVTNLTSTYASSQVKLNHDSTEWVLSNAGGAMGSMRILHASITEYLIIFGTPLGTEGHSGILSADDYFHILVGEQWAFAPGSFEMERYTAGTVHFLPRGVTKQYKMHRGCFALEYARGWIPPMLPFGLADTLTSTLDFFTLYHTARITAREVLRNLFVGKI